MNAADTVVSIDGLVKHYGKVEYFSADQRCQWIRESSSGIETPVWCGITRGV